jgi:proton-coupled amino acid transporter
LPVERQARHKESFMKLFVSGYSLVTALFISFGLIGYLAFGKDTLSVAVLNIPSKSWLTRISKVGFLIAAVCTYPLMMWPVIERLELALLYKKNRNQDQPIERVEDLIKGDKVEDGNIQKDPSSSNSNLSPNSNDVLPSRTGFLLVRSLLLRAFLVALTVLVAVTIPEFDLLTSLIGSLCSTTLAFILPGLFHIKLFPDSSLLVKTKDILVILFGILAMVVCTSVTIYDLIERMKHPERRDLG